MRNIKKNFILPSKFKSFLRKYWLLVCALSLSIIFASWFGVTILASAIYFNDPRHKDIDLKGWMTPRYIMLSYDLPRNVIIEVLRLDDSFIGKRPKLKDIATKQNITLEELTNKVRAAALKNRENNR